MSLTPFSDEELRLWRSRITLAKEFARPFQERFKDHVRFFVGDQVPIEADPMYSIVVNRIYSTVRAIVPSLFFRNPKVKIVPRKKTHTVQMEDPLTGEVAPREYDSAIGARALQDILNWLLPRINAKQQFKLSILDVELSGLGIIKVGHSGFSEPVKPNKERQPDDGEGTITGAVIPQSGISGSIFPGETVGEDQPFLVRVSPKDVFFPPQARAFGQLPWLVHRVFRPVDEVRSDPVYKNTENLKESGLVSEQWVESLAMTRPELKDSLRVVELYEVHYYKFDPDQGAVRPWIAVLAEGHDKILRNEPSPLAMNGFPFEFLRFNEVPDTWYPIADVAPAILPQLELNTLRSIGLEYAKRNLPKWVHSKGALTEEDRNRLEKAPLLGLVEVTNPQGLQLIKGGPLGNDYAQQSAMVDNDIRELTGITIQQRGGIANTTATEAGFAQANAQLRADEKLDIVLDFATSVVSKLGAVIQQFFTGDEYVLITDEPVPREVAFTPQEIAGEYVYAVDVTSVRPPNDEVDRKLLENMFNLAMRAPQLFNLRKIAAEWIKRNIQSADPESYLTPEVPEPVPADEILTVLATGQPFPVDQVKDHEGAVQMWRQLLDSPLWQILPDNYKAQLAPVIEQQMAQHVQFAQGPQGAQGGAPGAAAFQPTQGPAAAPELMAGSSPTAAALASGLRREVQALAQPGGPFSRGV